MFIRINILTKTQNLKYMFRGFPPFFVIHFDLLVCVVWFNSFLLCLKVEEERKKNNTIRVEKEHSTSLL